MRNVDLLSMVSPLLMAVAVGLLATRKRLVRRFERAAASSPETAIRLEGRSPVSRWWLARLTRAGVLRVTGGGLRWIDVEAWQAYRAVRRRRGLTVAATLLVLVALYFVFLR